MTSALGALSLLVLLLSWQDRKAHVWAMLLGMTWLGGFADYWFFPVVNAVAFWASLAIMVKQKQSFDSYAGLVTAVFPVMIAFDVGYRLGVSDAGVWFGMAYYYCLCLLFCFQLFVVGYHGYRSWVAWSKRHPEMDQGGLFRVIGGEQCRSLT